MLRDSKIFDATVAEAIRQAKLLFAPGTGRVAPAQAGTQQAMQRTTVALTTGSLAALATENGSVAIPCFSGILVTIQADRGAWIRLYTDNTSQTADSGRAFGTFPTAGTGVLAEFVFSGPATIPLSPVATLSNDEATLARRVWYTIQNRSGATSTVTMTLVLIPLET